MVNLLGGLAASAAVMLPLMALAAPLALLAPMMPLLLLGPSVVMSSPAQAASGLVDKMQERQATNRLVMAHFMVGIVADRTSAADYDLDMQQAKAAGIDAFALNIGTDSYTRQQLDYAYQSAANNGMKVFISFDFNWFDRNNPGAVGALIRDYASRPAQLKVDDKAFVSTFAGDGLDSQAVRNSAGTPIYWVPNFDPRLGTSMGPLDGAFSWQAWPTDGNNKAPKPGRLVSTTDGDGAYTSALGGGKSYMAGVSPWFFTHYGPEVPYSKNWVFPGDLLWYNRWNEVLRLGPRFVELVTWNDYGESHYVGPLASKHYDDGNSKWTNDMPHGGWLEMAKPFIAAYKAGARSADGFVKEDRLVYWYRPTPRGLNCDATDTTMQSANNGSGNYFMGRPDGWETMSDSVFVVAMLVAAGEVTINSGGNVRTVSAPAGISAHQVDMGLGSQSFRLSRSGRTVLEGTSLRPVSDVCPCGLYNFNAFVGTVAAGPSDPLHPDGIASLTVGLRVSTCRPTPSLGTVPGPPPPSPTPTNNPGGGDGSVCIEGQGLNNYAGLCSFCCHYGYCPTGPCTCKTWGQQVPPPPETGTPGKPAPGLDASYSGLCSYACNHGYCPSGACVFV